MPNKNMLDLSEKDLDTIKNIIKSYVSDKLTELEISFRNIQYPEYVRLVEKYIDLSNENAITSSVTLDINIEQPDKNVYRISLIGDEIITDFVRRFANAKYQDVLKYLSGLKSSENIIIINKNRGDADKIFLPEYGVVIKSTAETEPGKFPQNGKLLYRYKLRNTFEFDNYKVDLTEVYESPYLSNLNGKFPNYEFELEITNKKITIDNFFTYLSEAIASKQNTDVNLILSVNQKKNIIEKYNKLTDNKSTEILDSRNVISLEKQHVINYIPNKYVVTDKADGERYFLFISDDGCYLLSVNMDVKKINISTKKEFYNTIIDGELINIDGKLIFMAFDVVYHNEINYKYNTGSNTVARIKILDDIIDKCFNTFVKFTDYTDVHDDTDLEAIREFYNDELVKYWKKMNKMISESKNIFISKKLYLVPYGIHSSEIFMYADLIWKNYVGKKLVPYNLDGIIYTPINIPYLVKINPQELDSIPLEYKWKKETMNSIDFYVKFDKDMNGTDIIYTDEKGAYKKANLFVGYHNKGIEKPVNFKINGVVQIAHIPVSDAESRDVEDNIVRDSTVVEFVYSADHSVPMPKRWIALKTRYDKTESVMKYGKKYGNNLFISNRIWKSIQNPITEETIASLGNSLTYQKEYDIIKRSIGREVKSTDTYYEKKTDTAKEMRTFNNFVKNNMIQTYCKNKKSVLDIGCGRGGDINKFINANISEYVGIDIDANGLFIIPDSAVNRYNNLKASNKNIPKMTFIQADARVLFDEESQKAAIPTMTTKNMENITNHLKGKKFDIINCQFTIHYYLSDNISWNNFIKNISNHLSDHGYILITCFDGKLISSALKTKNKITISYTDNSGNKITFADIVKIYDETEIKNKSIGIGIDLYNSLINSPGTYLREYLVMPEFLDKEFNKINLDLIESDSFMGLFNVYRNYFTNNVYNPDTINNMNVKTFNDISKFYKLLDSKYNDSYPGDIVDLTIASYKFTMLNKYYIYKNSKTLDLSDPSRIITMTNKINPGKIFTTYFHQNSIYIDSEKKTRNASKIYKAIRDAHPKIKPSTYIIRHVIPSDVIDEHVYRSNNISIVKAKEGSNEHAVLIYKSPDKLFYPVYYLINGSKRQYLWTSAEAIDNLSYLSTLTI